MKRLEIEKVIVEEFEVKAKVGNWFTGLKGTKVANVINGKLIQNNKYEYSGILSDGERDMNVKFTSCRDFKQSTNEGILEETSYNTPLKYYG